MHLCEHLFLILLDVYLGVELMGHVIISMSKFFEEYFVPLFEAVF